MTLGGAVLLAAGRGRRIGSRPKSLLRVDGDLLIHRQIRVLKRLGIAPIIVVLGPVSYTHLTLPTIYSV